MGEIEGPAIEHKEVRCETVRVRQVIGEDTKQAAVKSRIIIPQEKPPAEQVINAHAQTAVQEVKIVGGRVTVEGRAHIQVTYVADKPSQPVHHVGGDIRFVETFKIPGAEADQDVMVRLTLEKVAVHLDESDRTRRAIAVTLVVKIFVKVTETVDVDLLVKAPERLYPAYRMVALSEVVAEGERQVVVSQQADFREMFEGVKPCPEKILDVISDLRVTEKEVIRDKVLVEGVITLQLIYVAKTWEGSQPVHHAHVEIPFTEFVHVKGAKPDMMVDLHLEIEDADARVKGYCDVGIAVVMQIRAEVTREREKKVVVKIKPNNLFDTITLYLDRVLKEVTKEVVVRDVVAIPQQKPSAQKVLDVFIVACEINEEEIVGRKLIIRGVITVKVTYVADKLTQPVHAVEVQVPFTTFVDLRHVHADLDDVQTTVDCAVDFETAELEDGRHIGLNLVVRAEVRVTKIVQQRVVICLGYHDHHHGHHHHGHHHHHKGDYQD